MKVLEASRVAIARWQLDWLERHSAAWRDEGLLDEVARQRILDRYDAGAPERRGMLVLMIIAVLMCGVGVALLIGYNWHRFPPAGKVTMLLAFVAAAFGASSIAYARGRRTAGELLALSGTLLFGNGIWLIAQVLHISGRYPDAFLWFTVGTLACAFLLHSALIGALASVLTIAWVIAEGTYVLEPNLLYLVVAPFVLIHAYRTGNAVVVPILAVATAVWAFLSGIESHPLVGVGAVALLGCAFHALGRLHGNHEFRPWWETSGLAVLLVGFVPLLIGNFHRDAVSEALPGLAVRMFGATLAASALVVVFARRPERVEEKALAAVAIAVPAWAVLQMLVLRGDAVNAPRIATILFSLLAIGVGVSLIRSALTTRSRHDLAAGVVFALVFLLIRWADVVDNLFWSGLFLLATGGGLLLVARLWQRRGPSAAHGSQS